MMAIRKLGFCLLFAIPALVSAEESAPVSPNAQILNEALKHFDLLREFYSNYSCDGEIVYERAVLPDKTLKRTGATRGAFAMRDDKKYRISGTWMGDECLLIATPERFHLFEKSVKSGNMFVRAQGKGYQVDSVPVEWFFRAGGYCPGYIPSIVGNLDPKNKAKILSVVVSREGDEDVTTVEASIPLEGRVELQRSTYYSDRHWALKDHQTVLGADTLKQNYMWYRMHCEYQGQVNGFPILKQLVSEDGYSTFGTAAVDHQQVYDPGEEVVIQRRTLTVEHFTPGPPDLSVFDPAPILKEIGGLGKPSPPWWRVWLLALNAIFLIWLGLFCWRRSRKQGRPPHTPNTSPLPPSPS